MAENDILNSVSNFKASSVPASFTINVYGLTASSTYTHNLLIKRDSTTLVTVTLSTPFAVGTQTVSVSLTTPQRATLLSGMSDVAQFNATFVLQTINNGTQIGNDSVAEAIISIDTWSASPTLADYTYSDAYNITGDNQRLLNGLSKLTFYNVSASGKYGASIVRYEVSASTGETKSFNSGGTLEWDGWGTSPFPSDANVVFTITAYDSRGFSTSKSTTIYVYAYSIAQLTSYSIQRNSTTPTSLDFNFTGTFAPARSNEPIILYKYRVSGSGAYSDEYEILSDDLTISGGNFSYIDTVSTSDPTMDTDHTYELVLMVSDNYTQNLAGYTQYYYITIPSQQMMLSFRDNAVGVGGVPTNTKAFEIAQGWKLVAIGDIQAHGKFESDGKNSRFSYMPNSWSAVGTAGSAGYARIATITISGTYANAPITFEVARRGDTRSVRLHLQFGSSSSTDPSLSSFKYESISGTSNFEAFAYKTSTSTWDIFVRKRENADSINVITTVPEYMQERVTLSYSDSLRSSVPSGATSATSL